MNVNKNNISTNAIARNIRKIIEIEILVYMLTLYRFKQNAEQEVICDLGFHILQNNLKNNYIYNKYK